MYPNELILTGDGSHSLLSRQFQVEYHSVHGAIQESRHVFIDAGLAPLLKQGVAEIRILEMGFGTGLNALLVRLLARQYPTVRFHYETYEQFPIAVSEVAALNYPVVLEADTQVFFGLHDCGWGVLHQLDHNFAFRKNQADFLIQAERPYPASFFDLVFYDAFAPRSQPELWTAAAMVVNWEALRLGGVLVTYCAKGQFKRDLKTVGFTVEGVPGPPGKREMTKATKQ
jgi:tRNA U34 5-methylaminomethyl-2-thiouridine-forming methyltransferase MnmC